MDDKKDISLDDFKRSTFTEEFINEADVEYKKTQDMISMSNIIKRLLRNRDSMGFQIDLAYENITREDYYKLNVDLWGSKEEDSFEELVHSCRVLFENVEGYYDSDTVALLIGCDIVRAEEVMEAVRVK